jgi:hypothetical protein
MQHRLLIALSGLAVWFLFLSTFPARATATTNHIYFAELLASTASGWPGSVDMTPDHGQTWQGGYATDGHQVRMATGAGISGRIPSIVVGTIGNGTQTQAFLSRFPFGTDSRDPAMHNIQPLNIYGNCQQGAALSTGANSSYIVVCASPPVQGVSQIAINIGGDEMWQWGGWQVIGGWGSLSNSAQTPVPSIIYDGANIQVLAQSPLDGSLWTMTYVWGGNVTPWRWLGKTSCTSTPLLASRPGSSSFSLACIARDTQSMWANTFTPGSSASLDVWRPIGAVGGGFTDLALTADPLTPNGTIYFSGLGKDHTVYTETATNATTYPSRSSWQQEFSDPALVGIASSYN